VKDLERETHALTQRFARATCFDSGDTRRSKNCKCFSNEYRNGTSRDDRRTRDYHAFFATRSLPVRLERIGNGWMPKDENEVWLVTRDAVTSKRVSTACVVGVS